MTVVQSKLWKWSATACAVLLALMLAQSGSRSIITDPQAAAAVRSVRYAAFRSRFSGSYWENEMERKYATVSNRLDARLEFLKGMVLFLDLDTTKAMTFEDLARPDATALRKHLIEFRLRAAAGGINLTAPEIQRLDAWTEALKIIEEQKAYESLDSRSAPEVSPETQARL